MQVKQETDIGAHILANFVRHEQQMEVLRLALHIFLDLGNQKLNGEFDRRFILKPSVSMILAHIEYFHQRRDNEFPLEGKTLTIFFPGLAAPLLIRCLESIIFSLPENVILQLRYFQVPAV